MRGSIYIFFHYEDKEKFVNVDSLKFQEYIFINNNIEIINRRFYE